MYWAPAPASGSLFGPFRSRPTLPNISTSPCPTPVTGNLQEQDARTTYSSVAKSTLNTRGPLGFYRGLSSMVYFAAPKAAIRFGSFEFFSGLLSNADGSDKYGLGPVSSFWTMVGFYGRSGAGRNGSNVSRVLQNALPPVQVVSASLYSRVLDRECCRHVPGERLGGGGSYLLDHQAQHGLRSSQGSIIVSLACVLSFNMRWS